MSPAGVALMLTFALSLAACGVGMAAGLGAGNFVKRVGGLVIAFLGAALACAALGAPTLSLALCVSLAATATLGAAISARIMEEYGVAESNAAAARHDVPDEGAAQ